LHTVKMTRRNVILGVVAILAIAAVLVLTVFSGTKTPTPPAGTTNNNTALGTPVASPAVRPGSTATVINIAATDPLLPFLVQGVHIDVLRLTANGSGGQTAQVIATDLVVLGVSPTGVIGAAPAQIATAVATAAAGSGGGGAATAATPAPPQEGLVVDVPAAEEGSLLPAQTAGSNIYYAIVGTGITTIPTPTPVPTAVPTAAPTPTPATPSPTSTALPSTSATN
jgi:hypothetical protein